MTKGAAGDQGGGPFDELLQDMLRLPTVNLSGMYNGIHISRNDLVALVEQHNARKRPPPNYGAILALTGVLAEILNCKVVGDTAVLNKDGVINAIANKVAALTQQ